MNKIVVPQNVSVNTRFLCKRGVNVSKVLHSLDIKSFNVQLQTVKEVWCISSEKLPNVECLHFSEETLEYFFDVEIHENVAVIPIKGVLTRYFSFWTWLYGGVSSEMIAEIVEFLSEGNLGIDTIIFDFNSPGGSGSGIEEAARVIKEASSKISIISFINDMCCSAAYWLASATNIIYTSGKMALSGSIGVVITHIDYSEQNKMRGIKVTEVTAGKEKRLVSSEKPLDDPGLESLEKEAEIIYNIMTSAISGNLGVTQEHLKEKMADGKTFFSEEAVELGLVQSIFEGTKSKLIDNYKKEVKPMTDVVIASIADLKKSYPELCNQLENDAVKKGMEQERNRIKDIESVIEPEFSNDEKVIALKFDESKNSGDMAKLMLSLIKSKPKETKSNKKSLKLQDFEGENKPVENLSEEVDDNMNDVEKKKKELLSQMPTTMQEARRLNLQPSSTPVTV